MSNSTERILLLIKKHNTTKAQLERDCGLANGTIHKWEIGRNNPSYGAIVKIAKFFNVPEESITGEETTEQQSVNTKKAKILELVNQLTLEEQEEVIKYAELLKRGRK